MSRVTVSPDMLRWARERSGKDAEALRRQFPKLDDWEAERLKPTLKQLEAYARATYAPFGFFFLEEPPEETFPIPFFRSAQTAAPQRPSPNLLDTLQAMQRRQDWLSEFLARDGEPRVPFVGSARVGEPTAALATRMRETLGFALGWARQVPSWEAALTTLRDAMDATGVLVVTNGVVGNNTHRKLDTGEFRGFVLVDDYAPLVFVNGADAKGAQLFTLVHELAHIWFGRSAAFDLKDMQPADDVIEQACNAVAAEFLVPEVELREQWRGVGDAAARFDTLARHFKVSSIVVARRALDLGLVRRQAFFAFYREHMDTVRERAQAAEPGGDFYRTQNVRLGKRFALAVVHAAQEGRIPYREAYSLTGMWGQTFDKFVTELQGARRR
jgi:Zn-dependent peptidase ImmA (M78 family)